MRIYRNKFDVIVIDLEGEKEISSIHVDTAGVLVVGEAIRPTKHALDAATPCQYCQRVHDSSLACPEYAAQTAAQVM